MEKSQLKDDGLRSRGTTNKEKSPKVIDQPDDKHNKIKIKSLWATVENYSFYCSIVFTVLGFVTRFYNLGHPAEVVFDEVHFGKFSSYYLRGEFFFDVHPPLAKLILALGAYFVGFKGNFDFETIGLKYVDYNVPYVGMRATSALFGALNVPLVFLICRESGYSLLPSILTTVFVLFDNSLVTQSRLILLDSQLVFFASLAIYCYIRFYKFKFGEFTSGWWFWLVATGVSLALTLGVKMVGLFTILTIGLAVIWDLWKLLDYQRGLPIDHVARHFFARVIGLILVPAVVYISFFWIHFQVLPKSGTGDAYMSPEFQSSLRGNNLFTQSSPIHYYDNITLINKNHKVYLHSHLARYPLRYPDGRISTQGQQVTGYPHQDFNNYWRIHPKQPFEDGEQHPVRNSDIVKLEHLGTSSFLLTHDVASPTMPTNEEVTTAPLNDTAKEPFMFFSIDLAQQEPGTPWESHIHLTKILHVATPVAVWTHRKVLPAWGFEQNEVNGNKQLHDEGNLWSVDNIMGINATTVEREPVSRPFLYKFFELHHQMLVKNNQISSSHPFATRPWQWPLTLRGCSYWTREADTEQIYLLGNPLGFLIGTIVVILYSLYLIVDTVFLRRGIDTLKPSIRFRLIRSGGFFLMGWILHYVPFFPMARQLFLHHYLPALIFKYLLVGAVFQFTCYPDVDVAVPDFPDIFDGVHTVPQTKGSLHCPTPSPLRYHQKAPVKAFGFGTVIAIILISLQTASFTYFAPLTYGISLKQPANVYARKWIPSWDFHFAKPPAIDINSIIKPAPQSADSNPPPDNNGSISEKMIQSNEKAPEISEAVLSSNDNIASSHS